MEAWEGEKLNRTNGRSRGRLHARVEGVIAPKRGRKRSPPPPPPALEKVNGAEELDGEATDPEEEEEGEEEEEPIARPEERDSSSDSSESSGNSSSSSSSSSSSGGSGSHPRSLRGPKGSLMGMADNANIWEQDEHGEHIVITCAENEARLYRERFGRGSIGKSVLFRNRWLTPNEFQAVSGRQSSKDWKRSIRLKGRCLKEYINDGLFTEHEKSCTCKVCLGGDPELLRQEGVLALAAKRRRLSQADGGAGSGAYGLNSNMHGSATTATASSTPTTNNHHTTIPGNATTAHHNVGQTTPTPDNHVATPTAAASGMASTLAEGTSERKLPGSTGVGVKRKRKSGGRGKKKQRVWSPSGELAQEMEQQEGEEGSSNDEEHFKQGSVDGATPSKSSVIDASDFLPRRSKRSSHRKHTGHRTELGTYSHKPSEWDAEEVAEFLRLQGFTDYADSFHEYEIDGQSMFLLKEHHLLEKFSMKLGPALRLLDTISRLRHPPA